MEKNLKVVMVTGGAQGIGKGITRHFLDLGFAVVMADIDDEAGAETAAEYASAGDILFSQTDVSDEASVARCLSVIGKKYRRLDALINNAANPKPHAGSLEELDLARWNRILAVNLTGCVLTAKYAVPLLRRSHGAIVNISSTRAFQSDPNSEAYAATKGGILALTHAMALSLGPDIRVNCISPGWIDTSEWKKKSYPKRRSEITKEDHSQHPVGRIGTPEDIASLAAYLVSESAGFITGQNFIADGGMTRKMIYV